MSFQALLVEKMCSFGGVSPPIPNHHELTLKIAYDKSLHDKETDPQQWISEVMTHAQAHFHHPSLPTKIDLKVLFQLTKYLLNEIHENTLF